MGANPNIHQSHYDISYEDVQLDLDDEKGGTDMIMRDTIFIAENVNGQRPHRDGNDSGLKYS